MFFTPFSWISVSLAIVLQSIAYWKLPQPRSLRYLMLWLTAGNFVAILTHSHPKAYWLTLWLGRMVATVWFCYAAGDVISPRERHWTIRIPAFTCLATAFLCLPWHPETDLMALESFRWHGLFLALAVVVVGAIWLVPSGHDLRLPIALAGCLLAEGTGSLATTITGYAPHFQMIAWAAGMVVLAGVAVGLNVLHTSHCGFVNPASPCLARAGAGESGIGQSQPPD